MMEEPERCSHCNRIKRTEPAVRQDRTNVRLCPDCLWLYDNMGWNTDDITRGKSMSDQTKLSTKKLEDAIPEMLDKLYGKGQWELHLKPKGGLPGWIFTKVHYPDPTPKGLFPNPFGAPALREEYERYAASRPFKLTDQQRKELEEGYSVPQEQIMQHIEREIQKVTGTK